MTLLQESETAAGALMDGCCFETLNPLTGRIQSHHHETVSTRILLTKGLRLVIILAPSMLPSSATWLGHLPPIIACTRLCP
jgi:hypothetical protein